MKRNLSRLFNRIKIYKPYIHFKEIPLTLFSLLWVLTVIYPVYIAISLVDKINPYSYLPIEQKFIIYDPILNVLTTLFKQTKLPKNISDILVGVGFIVLFLRCSINGKKSLLLLRRSFYIVGLLYLIRVPFLFFTLLPCPSIECIPHRNENLFLDALNLMLFKRESCADLMYSGHTIIFTISSLLWIVYPVTRNNYINLILNSLFYSFNFIGMISLIASSYHYTLDVVISYFICNTVFWLYHFIVKTSYFKHLWWAKFIRLIDYEVHFIDHDYVELATIEKLV